MMEVIKEWQDLIGTFLGGIFSLAVALLVAYIPIRREDMASAMLVVSNLVSARSRQVTLRRLAHAEAIDEAGYSLWLSEKLLFSRPKLTSTYDIASMRVMAVDAHLAAHLSLFDMAIRELSEKLDRLAGDFDAMRETGEMLRSLQVVQSDAKLVSEDLDRLAQHAQCAERLITLLILSRLRIWNKWRRKGRPTADEQACLAVLK